MVAQLIDGKALAIKLRREIANTIDKRVAQGLSRPGLAVILVGEDPASLIYVRNKRLACDEVGIQSSYYHLPATVTTMELMNVIQRVNEEKTVHGILLQLPLPSHIDDDVLELIDPKKDVDGFHPYNLGRLAQRRPLLRPCTPYGIMKMLDSMGQQYKGKHAVIVGASNIVGRPMALELLMAGSTVTVCHRFTADLGSFVSQGDIVVAAAGRPGLVKGEWIKPGATVIDVAMNRLENGSIIGDVEFIKAKENAAWITPVPGGVGPMTVVMLLQNTLSAAISRDSVLPT